MAPLKGDAQLTVGFFNPLKRFVEAIFLTLRNLLGESATAAECAPDMRSDSPICSDTLAKICDRDAISLSTSETSDNGTLLASLILDWNIGSPVLYGEDEPIDSLKIQHFGPLNNLHLERQDPGRGHHFKELSVSHPTWCDKCGDFMWGFLTDAVKCEHCNYTCHDKCKALVTLDCKSYEDTLKTTKSDDSYSQSPIPSIYPQLYMDDKEAVPDSETSSESATNTDSSSPQRTYYGCIQIHMNFTRPINVVAGEVCPTIFDVTNTTGKSSLDAFGTITWSLSYFTRTSEWTKYGKFIITFYILGSTATAQRTITTFFLPRDTVKTVNISSEMTTREMIVTLLRKFKVADNPRKFSLYERVFDTTDGSVETELIRVADDAHPLRIARSWVMLNQSRQFVLQESDTGDILWEMFEVPELENFLRILAIEEKQYTFKIRQKYNAYLCNINQQLRFRGYNVEDNSECNGTPV
ncbi:unnamed protein product [Enterobius vermicularis]|uniref:Phorbol-ester/DAG-type domain-containing protein n=1 Tax=Enterobius vermicularis TaxID=51028 RepID=A0A0N4VHR0_ENTVE|nr:unnamed protein product [Enterobius vermicularis]